MPLYWDKNIQLKVKNNGEIASKKTKNHSSEPLTFCVKM